MSTVKLLVGKINELLDCFIFVLLIVWQANVPNKLDCMKLSNCKE